MVTQAQEQDAPIPLAVDRLQYQVVPMEGHLEVVVAMALQDVV